MEVGDVTIPLGGRTLDKGEVVELATPQGSWSASTKLILTMHTCRQTGHCNPNLR